MGEKWAHFFLPLHLDILDWVNYLPIYVLDWLRADGQNYFWPASESYIVPTSVFYVTSVLTHYNPQSYLSTWWAGKGPMLKPTLVHISPTNVHPTGPPFTNSVVLRGVLMNDYTVAILCNIMRGVWNCFIHFGNKDFNFILRFLRTLLLWQVAIDLLTPFISVKWIQWICYNSYRTAFVLQSWLETLCLHLIHFQYHSYTERKPTLVLHTCVIFHDSKSQ